MKLKTTLLATALLFPILSSANDIKSKNDPKSESKKLESMDIKTLIEKAKYVSSQERRKIESLIKKKISKAHRATFING